MRCDICNKDMGILNYNVKMMSDGVAIVCPACLNRETHIDYMDAAKEKSMREKYCTDYSLGGPVRDNRGMYR